MKPTEPSRVDEVYRRILLSIIRGELKSGEELKTTEVAKRFEVSRTPVVQAFARLMADGIVTQRLNHRAMVRPGAEMWLAEVHELRELLEPRAARLAAKRISDEDIVQLEQLAEAACPDDSDRPSDKWAERARRFDFALHLTIASACGQLALTEAIRKCWTFKRISYEAFNEPNHIHAKGYDDHLQILAAVKAHDGPTAEAAMLFHLRSTALLRPEVWDAPTAGTTK